MARLVFGGNKCCFFSDLDSTTADLRLLDMSLEEVEIMNQMVRVCFHCK